MEELKQETVLKLDKQQLQTSITNHILETNDLVTYEEIIEL